MTEVFTQHLSQFKLPKKTVNKLINELVQYEESSEIFYEVLGRLHSGESVQEIINDLKKESVEWKSSCFKEIHESRQQTDSLIENPPEIKEGDTPCPKCKTKKTVIVERQTRSCDEGFTYELHCYNPKCKHVQRT